MGYGQGPAGASRVGARVPVAPAFHPAVVVVVPGTSVVSGPDTPTVLGTTLPGQVLHLPWQVLHLPW